MITGPQWWKATYLSSIYLTMKLYIHMWQSCVEIKGYSVVYFDRIAAFEAPYRWTSVKGGAHTYFVDA